MAISGWKELSGGGAWTSAAACGMPVCAVSSTPTFPGTRRAGTNLDLYRELVTIQGLEITASGGVSSLEELRELRKIGAKAAILGKALYTGRLDLKTVIREVGAC